MVKSNDKPGVSPLFISTVQGIGKSIFFGWLITDILGEANAISSPTLTRVITRFNAITNNKRLILVNEAKYSQSVDKDEFKSRITESQVITESKGVNAQSIDSNECYILCSNDLEQTSITCRERRMCVIGCLEEKMTEFEFERFSKCRSECADDFMTFLTNVDINGYHPSTFPVTELKKEIIESNLSLEGQFCSTYLIGGKQKRSDTYAAYVKWLGDEKIAGRVSHDYKEVGSKKFISSAGNIASTQSNGKHYYKLTK